MMPRNTSTILFRESDQYEPQLIEEMRRLHNLFVTGRWCVILALWLLVGSASLWSLRDEFVLIAQHFTWAAVRYGLAFNIVATLGLSICVGSTVGLLVWQTRNVLMGLPKKEVAQLAHKVTNIRKQGSSHPLWRYVCATP